MNEIKDAVFRLKDWIERAGYAGHDPYDALKSPLFRVPLLDSNKLIRFGAQQFVKRSPINLRPLLAIPKGKNPVTLGLCVQGYTDLLAAGLIQAERYAPRIDALLEDLARMIPCGYSGACWGYDFDWQARHASIPAFQPTVVATGIVVNSLYQAYRTTGNVALVEHLPGAAAFVTNDLHNTAAGDGFCFSYSPFDKQCVFNASMKGARILAQVYELSGNPDCLEKARLAVAYVCRHQREDGSWKYSLAADGKWTDNYHTGYVLDCLAEYIRCTGDDQWNDALDKGYRYYRGTFFNPDGSTMTYAGKALPVDCTAIGQSLLTLTRFGDLGMAEKTARWAIAAMQSPEGFFYYKKRRNGLDKTSFMRWSDAWMFAGLAAVLRKSHEMQQPS